MQKRKRNKAYTCMNYLKDDYENDLIDFMNHSLMYYSYFLVVKLNNLKDPNEYLYYFLSEYYRYAVCKVTESRFRMTDSHFNKAKSYQHCLDFVKSNLDNFINHGLEVKKSYPGLIGEITIKPKYSDYDHLFSLFCNTEVLFKDELKYWNMPDNGYRYFRLWIEKRCYIEDENYD